jgi:hypothetical protein
MKEILEEKMKLPYRKRITSMGEEQLRKHLEPWFGDKEKGQFFIGFGVGPGWSDIILDLHNKLVAENPEYSIAQVKEKFGTLRYYVDGISNDGSILIAQAENESSVTCEECGRPGKLRDTSWIRTLCDYDYTISRINAWIWVNIRRRPYTIYWKIRFAYNRWLRKRGGEI